ncbi:hypothetical protein Tco_0723896 [Tanacetum coccineum]
MILPKNDHLESTPCLNLWDDEKCKSGASEKLLQCHVGRRIVGNHILHTLKTGVCMVARIVAMCICFDHMVEMGLGDGKFVMRIGFDNTFMMGMGYDNMLSMVAHTVDLGYGKLVAHLLEIVYVCLQAA